MTCRNCQHPFSGHVTLVTDNETHPIVTVCYYPIHRNYDCPCDAFSREMNNSPIQ